MPKGVSISCRILGISSKELQHHFDELPDTVKKPPSYARNFLEFCSYKALCMDVTRPNYLSDQEFRRLIFDMMLAWEAPGVDNEPQDGVRRNFVLPFIFLELNKESKLCSIRIIY